MLITSAQIQATLDRHQDLRAAIARDYLNTVATQLPPSATPRLTYRIRASLCHAVASLAALASIV